MINVLVTGATGFAGGYLCEHLLARGKYNISGIYCREESLQKSSLKDKIKFIKADLRNSDGIYEAVKSFQPNYIFHLAGSSAPKDSFKEPISTMHNNYESQINLFEAVKKAGLEGTKILITSSGDIYGKLTSEDLPVNENIAFHPVSPYAVSKIAQDMAGYQYFCAFNMQIITARPFNHIGPGQDNRFVISDFSKQIAEIEAGKADPVMRTGNMSARRDFTDVRDMVKAYLLLIEKGSPGEAYNIGSGRSLSIKEALDILLGFSSSIIRLDDDPAKYRPGDIAEIVCDYSKMKKITGWKPTIAIEETLRNTLDYWRKIV